MELGKIIISLILSVILVRIGRNLRMRITGASAVLVNSRTNVVLIIVVAFFIYAALSG